MEELFSSRWAQSFSRHKASGVQISLQFDEFFNIFLTSKTCWDILYFVWSRKTVQRDEQQFFRNPHYLQFTT